MNLPQNENDWLVYMIRCSDDSLYTGITKDIASRVRKHAARRGARFFRGRAPEQVVYLEDGHSRSSATRREAEIKRLRRVEKQRLIAAAGNLAAAFKGMRFGPEPEG